jgi:hypothetical protein
VEADNGAAVYMYQCDNNRRRDHHSSIHHQSVVCLTTRP